ncbi:MAG: hypothetical protein EBR82_22655 [Caulobacteraceae bacterium]|nr:hypothetical protein [Caulobacteraceae bacterium]
MADKTCPIHFISYPEQLDECPYCVEVRREEAAKPRPPEAPASGEDQTALLAGIDALAEAAPAPLAVPGTDLVLVPTFEPAPDPETIILGAAVIDEAPPAVEPAPDADPLKPAARPAPRRPARGLAGAPEHDQPVSETLLNSWKTADQNVVVLLGFASAGKSWFLTRLKHKLFHDPWFPLRSEPAFADQGARVSRSNNISSHSFLPVGGAEGAHADDVFHIIDMPGERFEGVAGIDLFGRREELLALQVCKSVIIVLPADEVLLAERAAERYALWEDEVPGKSRVPRAQQTLEAQARELAKSNPQLERFIKTLGRLQDLLSLLETGVDVDEVIAMGRDGVIAHAATAKRPSKPVFIGLAKADVIKDYIREIQDAYADGVPEKPVNLLHLLFKDAEEDLLALEKFDDDPLTTVRRFRRGLVQCMEGFRWCKLDFVTAFAESEDPARRKRDPLRVDYSRRSWGVVPVIRWIQWAGRGQQLSSRADWAFISAARAIRRFRDDGRLTPLKRRSL